MRLYSGFVNSFYNIFLKVYLTVKLGIFGNFLVIFMGTFALMFSVGNYFDLPSIK